VSTLLEYKCPGCGGAIEFDSELQVMKCPYCDNEFEVDALKSYDEALNADTEKSLEWSAYDEGSGNGDWKEGEKDGLYTYSCASCGGEIICEENTGATKCPYCDNQVVIASQFSGMLRPDFVIPFKLDKKHAKLKLKEFYSKKYLLPSSFKTENKIDSIVGIYVPFWLFSCNAVSHIRYKGVKTHFYSDNYYDYSEENHFLVTRGGEMKFGNIPVDGSLKINDTDMESIEPFLYDALQDFQTAYLAGYIAEKYDVDADAAIPRANERIKSTVLDIMAPREYDSYVAENESIQLTEDKVSYALLPLWILNTKYKDKVYTFFMNGQTGKFSGELPISIGRASMFFSGIFASIVSVAAVIVYFII